MPVGAENDLFSKRIFAWSVCVMQDKSISEIGEKVANLLKKVPPNKALSALQIAKVLINDRWTQEIEKSSSSNHT